MKYTLPFLLIVFFLFSSCKEKSTNPKTSSNIAVASLFAINGSDSVTLAWTDVEFGTAYNIEIYRSDNEDFTPSSGNRIATIPGAQKSYVDLNNIHNDSTYCYKIIPFERDANGTRIKGKTSNVAFGMPYNYNESFQVKYSEHIQRIFTSSCAVEACHEAAEKRMFAKQRGNGNSPFKHGGSFSLASWEDAVTGGDDGGIIVPYHMDRSDLIAHTNTDTTVAPVVLGDLHMPRGDISLPWNQIKTLMQWINEGAKNDAGYVPYPYSPQGKMYVVNAEADLIAVIDVATQRLIRYVNVASSFNPPTAFGSPHHVKVDPVKRFFYVTLIELGEVWQFSIDSNKFVAKVQNIQKPADLVISPSGDTIYVASFNTTGNGKVYVLKATPTFQKIAEISLGSFATMPHGLALSHDGQRLYTTNTTSGNISEISVSDFSAQTRSLDTIFNLDHRSYDPYMMELSTDDRFIWVTCKGDSSVRMFDRTISEEHIAKIIPVGSRPLHPDIPPNETEMWVCNSGSNNLTIVNLSNYSETTIWEVGRQPHDIEFTPDGNFGFLTLENISNPNPPHHPIVGGKGTSFVVIINAVTHEFIKQIEVGGWSQNCAFAPASVN